MHSTLFVMCVLLSYIVTLLAMCRSHVTMYVTFSAIIMVARFALRTVQLASVVLHLAVNVLHLTMYVTIFT